MNLFKSECLYDPDTKQWIEKYWINEEEVDGDLYFFKQDREKDIEDKKLELEKQTQDIYNICHQECENCDGCCEECVNEDEIEVEYGEMLDIFVNKIRNSCHCPECIKEILDEFADVIIDNFNDDFDDTDDCQECKCNKCECNQEELTDQQLEEVRLIEEFSYIIENTLCDCGYELRDILFKLYSIGKNIGYKDCEDRMREFLG